MEEELLHSVFGPTLSSSRKLEFSTLRETLSEHIYSLSNPESGRNNTHTSNLSDSQSSVNEQEGKGRLGPRVVQLSRSANLGPLVLSDGDTEIEAHCHLGSALATVCVYEGKWQYEATLGTPGIQQIGWAGPGSARQFTNQEGVGDSQDSYAFDGKRVMKWHDGSEPYGFPWVAGDVIGSCIDMDAGSITFYRNGVSMGVAFDRVKKGTGYFPAISLSYGEKCLFNFGRRPFVYPVEGYAPLQAVPQINPVSSPSSSFSHSSISYLISCLRTLLHLEQKHLHQQHTNITHDDILITASIIFEYLAPALRHEYHVVNLWYPFLVSVVTDEKLLEILIEWMQLFMEDFEWKQCIGYLLQYLGYKCRTTGIMQAMRLNSENTNENRHTSPERTCFSSLALVVALFRIPNILNFAISLEGVFSLLELFITFKPPSKSDLAILLPYVWWQGGESNPSCSESQFLHDMGIMNAHIEVYDNLVHDLFKALLRANNPQFTHIEDTLINTTQPSTLFFYNWLTHLVAKNKGANRNVLPLGLSSSSVLVNTYFALLRLLFPDDHPVSLTTKLQNMFSSLFYQSTGTISEFSRLGGALGHLQKTIAKEPTNPDPTVSLDVVIVDAVVILFHLGVSSRFKTNSQQQMASQRDLAQLKEARGDTTLLPRVVDGLRLTNYSRAILTGDKIRIDRKSQFTRLVKQEIMYKKTVFLSDLLMTLSQQGSVFSFVPEYYMESMVDCFNSLRRAVPPLPFTTEAPYTQGLEKVITALVSFFTDSRIVNPDVKDLLLQSLGVLMQYPEYFAFVESLVTTTTIEGDPLQIALVRGLLQAFDKKFWITVTPLLLRFWKGYGLGQISATAPPSKVFRDVFVDIVTKDTALLDSFLNNLFNVLNSTISEFFYMKLDLTTMAPNDIRKANILYELSINLLRILEFISLEKPDALIGNELNLTRLVELLLLILSRNVIVPEADRLDAILVLEPHVTRAWILAPLIGILLSLDKRSTESSHSLYDALLSDASFKLEAFEALLKFSWQQVSQSSEWLKDFELFVEKLKTHEAAKKSSSGGLSKSSSMDLCTICYGAPIDTQFEPCKHSSCHRCISRHLLNNKRCFFCNADVESTHPVNT